MQSRATVALGMLIVSGSLVLGGCGGGGSGKRLSKAEFSARANAICSMFAKKAAERVAAAGDPSSLKDAADITAGLLPLYAREIASLKVLVPPGDEQEAFEQAIDLSEDIRGVDEKIVAAVKKNDLAGAMKLAHENVATSRKQSLLYTELDLTKCALREQSEARPSVGAT
jgi:hypothetical protein